MGESKHGNLGGSRGAGRVEKQKPKDGPKRCSRVHELHAASDLIGCYKCVHVPSLLCRRLQIPKTKGRKTKINFSLFYPAMSSPLFISEAPPDKIRLSIMDFAASSPLHFY